MFAISRMHGAHQPHPMIIFASYVPRSLTVDDAVTLVKELKEVLGKDFPYADNQAPHGISSWDKSEERDTAAASSEKARVPSWGRKK